MQKAAQNKNESRMFIWSRLVQLIEDPADALVFIRSSGDWNTADIRVYAKGWMISTQWAHGQLSQ